MLKKQNNLPLVSVIIPAYNEEKYIKECISSLKNQTFKDFEAIVVDDGSTDSTYSEAIKCGARIVQLSHGGPGRAKNHGANIAKGRILVFLDADMFVDKHYLENIIKPIQENKCISTYTVVEHVANKNNMWSKCWNINLDLPPGHRISKRDKTIGLAFRAIIKDKFLEIGGFLPNMGYSDDRSISRKIIHACPIKDAFCYHYNPESLKDVFFSARWIGRSSDFENNRSNLIKYSIFNSIRNSFNKIRNGAPLKFIIFKIVFDLGIFTGILFKNKKQNFSK